MHNIETINGKAQMAYAGEVPWHGLGTKVPADLTSTQMLEAAGLDWKVSKIPAFADVNGVSIDVGHSALVRDLDSKILDVVSNDWNPVQNEEAFEFFNDFVMAGDMEMHTAGSLQEGKIVWALAKVKDSFSLFKGDQVDSYLLFTNFHKYGCSVDLRFQPIRVVCNNTLTLALDSKVDRMVKMSHRRKFNPDKVKEMLGIAKEKMQEYRERAEFLGSTMASNDNLALYFKNVFPVTGAPKDGKVPKDMSRNATQAMNVMETQPGSEFAPGSWWQAYNAVSFMTDHIVGRSNDTRMASSWYGVNKGTKLRALDLAIEFAEAA